MFPEKFVLWGSAGHAMVLDDLIALHGSRVVALFDNNLKATSCLTAVPLYYGTSGLQAWLNEHDGLDCYAAALAIGGHRGKERRRLAKALKDVGLALPTLVHPSAVVSRSANIMDGCQILAQAVVAANVFIGELCILNNSANIDHECMLGNGVHIAPGAVLCGCVSVGDNTMVGAGAVVLPRLRIGKDVIIGAGAVVTKHVPDGVVLAGNPAKLIGVKSD